MDNCNRQYASCSLALNAATARVETEYVIYAHQDVELPGEDTLARFAGYLAQTGEADLLGVAGIVPGTIPGRKKRFGEAEGIVLSGVQHGAGELAAAGEQAFSGMRACDSLDECFFGGHTAHFKKNPFDEKLCDNWHLYGVERCLHTRWHGGNVYVCDVALIHHSTGHINHAYNENFRRLAKRYAGMQCIRTVCGSSKTGFWHRNVFYWKREFLIRLGRLG